MQRLLTMAGTVGAAIAAVGAIGTQCLYNVDPGHRVIIFDRLRGVRERVWGEGTHFIWPLIQTPVFFDIRSRARSVSVTTGSKDLQNVSLTLRVLFRPKASELARIYTSIGHDYDERVLPSIVNEVLKAVVAQFDASELITQREVVSQKVSEELFQRSSHFGLILDDIALTHLTFGSEFLSAVEAKQVAQQDAERARFLVEMAEQEKRAVIISAEGDSKAAELVSKALASAGDGLVELRRIEAAEAIAADVSGSRNVVFLPEGQQTLLSLPQN